MSKKLLFLIIAITIVVIAGCSQAAAIGNSSAEKPVVSSGTQPPAIPETKPITDTQESKTVAATPATPPVPKSENLKLYKIAEIMKDSANLLGKPVIIEGKIMSECGSGCWFTLNDGSGTIFVDLAPSNLVIPQKRGAKAKVYGNVTVEKGETYLIGTKVEF